MPRRTATRAPTAAERPSGGRSESSARPRRNAHTLCTSFPRRQTTTLLGHTSLAQLEEDLGFYKESKPLPPQLLWEVDRVHMRNRLPIFASTRVGKDWDGEGEIGEPIP